MPEEIVIDLEDRRRGNPELATEDIEPSPNVLNTRVEPLIYVRTNSSGVSINNKVI